MTAEDYVYSIKRLADPENRSPSANFIRGKIVGLDAQVRKAKKTGKFDYDAPVAGLQAMDRYTLRIRLNAPDSNFLYVLAYGALAAVSKEAVDAYGNKIGSHPVGTGPSHAGRIRPAQQGRAGRQSKLSRLHLGFQIDWKRMGRATGP